MTALMWEPLHPQLRELWVDAAADARPATVQARPHRAGAVLVIVGSFLLGAGSGGCYAMWRTAAAAPAALAALASHL
jgi:hypothetical protein